MDIYRDKGTKVSSQIYAIANYIAYNKGDVAIISALLRFYLAKAVFQAD